MIYLFVCLCSYLLQLPQLFNMRDKSQHFASQSAHLHFVLHPSRCVLKVQKANTDCCIFKHRKTDKAQNLIDAKCHKTPSVH